MPERATRTRRGGSAARRAVKAAATPASAVHPGLSGGQYRPLSDADIQRIYATALDILEKIGIGEPIPDYAIDKLFDRFYSLPNRKGQKGSGIGLSFVREVAKLHSGSASIGNEQPAIVSASVTLSKDPSPNALR